jgi:hypothetical protein
MASPAKSGAAQNRVKAKEGYCMSTSKVFGSGFTVSLKPLVAGS